MLLQACIDDSGSDPQSDAYVLAGWIAPAETWQAFSAEWREVLDAKPAAKHFKMSHAMGLHKVFEGWDHIARDRKVMDLGRVVARHAAIRLGVGVNRRLYDRLIKPSGFPARFFKDPYFMLFYECVMLISRYMDEEHRNSASCEIVFDNHGKIGRRAQSYWDDAVVFFQNVGVSVTLSRPVFRDDEDFLPLQAADMFAWMARQRGLFGDDESPIVKPLLDLWAHIPGRTKHVDADSLIELTAGFLVAGAKASRERRPPS